jgi:hypothetical protein
MHWRLRMNHPFFRAAVIVAVALGVCGTLSAQGITVQEPVVEDFSVDTVVSAPDRGAAFLGGVSSAAQGSSVYGPFPFGSSSGFSRMHAGTNVGVYIHDLDAMDHDLLSQPTGEDHNEWVNPNRRAAAAFDALRGDYIVSSSRPIPHGMSADRSARSAATGRSGPPETDDPAELAEFYLSHGRNAEQRGKVGVAALWYQMAARHGSGLAEQKLRELGRR